MMNKKGAKSQMTKNQTIGTITTRQCPTCGHHEVGYTTRDGAFHPLKPGDQIQVLEQMGAGAPLTILENADQSMLREVDEQPMEYDIWVPEPVQCDRTLSMKYGVLIPAGLLEGDMTGAFYEMAYLQKMIMLIEKESFTPLPFLLDRFFSAPNLAAGSPKQIAQALFQELEEVREPVICVKEWLEKQDGPSITKLIRPKTIEGVSNTPIDHDDLKQTLQNLTLEAFLELL
jgi:hypothetical protein